MVQSAPKLLTVDEFISYYGDSDSVSPLETLRERGACALHSALLLSADRYELIDGELIEMEPTRPHEQVSAFIGRKLNVEIDRQDATYFIRYITPTQSYPSLDFSLAR